MSNEEILKTILKGEPELPRELLEAATPANAALGPLLVELVRSIRLWHTEEAGRWAVLHAIRLISELPVKNAIPALIDAIFLAASTRHEDALEELPVALAHKGEAAIRPLESVMEDSRLEGTIRSVAASALEGIAVLNPSARESVLEILRKPLRSAGDLSSIRSHVITILAHFRTPEDLPLIQQVARTLPLMLDMEPEEIEAYFQQRGDPDSWAVYRESLLGNYRG